MFQINGVDIKKRRDIKKAMKVLKGWDSVMQLRHCTKCHHEWQDVDNHRPNCGWCGAPGKLIKN